MNTSLLIDEDNWYFDIGQRIKIARKELNITQEQLAKRAGLKRTSITNIEKGLQKTSVYTLYKLSYLLDKSLYELMPYIPTKSVVNVEGKQTIVTPKSESLIKELLGN